MSIKYGISIENFICDEVSICREERQYAVFLYNILQKYRDPDSRKGKTKVQEIFQACGLEGNVVVEHVFYEATFMRDFFERDRRLRLSNESEWPEKLKNKKFTPSKGNVLSEKSFNEELIRYVWKWGKEDEKDGDEIEMEYAKLEHNLGQEKIGDDKLSINGKEVPETKKKWILYRVRWMMNAKPDIAVIYRTSDGQNYLLFLECKFNFGESSYSYEDETGKQVMKQSEIQWRVADFLKQYLGGIEVANCKKEKRSQLVKFVRKDKKEDNEIQIEDLIEMNKEMFK
ncbi:MAG: hypothetical protein NC307_04525 [Roseburia sp.]|nr:hypothetical protein [Roseburia sp.]